MKLNSNVDSTKRSIVTVPFGAVRTALFTLVLLIAALAADAGEKQVVDFKQTEPSITSSDRWYFNLGSPGWLAGISGDIGLSGVTSEVDVGFDKIIKQIDGLMSLSAEARKGRLGFYADFLYLSASDAAYNNGLLSKVNIGVDQYLVDGEVYFRIVDCPRGWLDLRAGARYANIYNSTELVGNDRLAALAAVDFANALPGEVEGLLERRLAGLLDGRDPSLPVAPLAFGQKAKLLALILAARQIPDPGARVQKIAKILNKELNRSFSLSEDWFDPYIGIGGRYNLSKAFYVTAKADVGGFGVGSDISVQASGALGCQITRSIYSELGYRYFYVDYDDNGFVYDVSTQGIQITTGIIF